MTGLMKSLWLIGGTACLGLGIAGIFLPILPTTPFLLLAAFCYGRGSRRFYDWLVQRSALGGYIRPYLEGRGIPLSQKVWTLVFLWLSIGLSIAFVVDAWSLRALLLVIAVGVTIHLGRIRTRQPDQSGSVDQIISMQSTDRAEPFSTELE